MAFQKAPVFRFSLEVIKNNLTLNLKQNWKTMHLAIQK